MVVTSGYYGFPSDATRGRVTTTDWWRRRASRRTLDDGEDGPTRPGVAGGPVHWVIEIQFADCIITDGHVHIAAAAAAAR